MLAYINGISELHNSWFIEFDCVDTNSSWVIENILKNPTFESSIVGFEISNENVMRVFKGIEFLDEDMEGSWFEISLTDGNGYPATQYIDEDYEKGVEIKIEKIKFLKS